MWFNYKQIFSHIIAGIVLFWYLSWLKMGYINILTHFSFFCIVLSPLLFLISSLIYLIISVILKLLLCCLRIISVTPIKFTFCFSLLINLTSIPLKASSMNATMIWPISIKGREFVHDEQGAPQSAKEKKNGGAQWKFSNLTEQFKLKEN